MTVECCIGGGGGGRGKAGFLSELDTGVGDLAGCPRFEATLSDAPKCGEVAGPKESTETVFNGLAGVADDA